MIENENSKYDYLKMMYDEIIKKFADNKDTKTYYIAELNLAKKLKEAAQMEGREKERLEWIEKEQEMKKILKDKFKLEFLDK